MSGASLLCLCTLGLPRDSGGLRIGLERLIRGSKPCPGIGASEHTHYRLRSTSPRVLYDGDTPQPLAVWILGPCACREIGLIWMDKDSKNHTLHLTARSGKAQEIGAGYMTSLIVDGEERPALGVGEEAKSGFLTLRRLPVEKLGRYSMDTFSLEIQGLLNLRLQMRPAHPSHQTPTDAQVHFNVHIRHLEVQYRTVVLARCSSALSCYQGAGISQLSCSGFSSTALRRT